MLSTQIHFYMGVLHSLFDSFLKHSKIFLITSSLTQCSVQSRVPRRVSLRRKTLRRCWIARWHERQDDKKTANSLGTWARKPELQPIKTITQSLPNATVVEKRDFFRLLTLCHSHQRNGWSSDKTKIYSRDKFTTVLLWSCSEWRKARTIMATFTVIGTLMTHYSLCL